VPRYLATVEEPGQGRIEIEVEADDPEDLARRVSADGLWLVSFAEAPSTG
jgi:hypothetical protein